jgi:unsaturated rhamnogalacturonyl hydrolase
MPTAGSTTLADLTRVADRTTDWRFHCWYWGDAIAIDGLLEADSLGAGSYRDAVIETLQRWHHYCLPNFDDVLAPGAAIIQLVMDGDLPAAAAERLFDRLEGLPMVYGDVPSLEPHRLVFRYGVCIDAVYHLPATYALAARWRDDAELERKAVRIAVDSMKVLRCNSGWAQWFDPTRKKNNGVAWTRGLGWAVLGLLDLVHILDGRGADEVAALAGEVLELLAATQAPDGNWAEVLDHAPAGIETSTASFYVAAALHPATAQIVTLAPDVLERAIEACHRALADDGTFTGVTTDVLPSWDITTYENCPTEPSPWAQGAAVRAFAAIARA